MLPSPRNPPLASLRELGYEEGRNLVVEVLSASDDVAALPDLAVHLVASGPDVLLAFANPEVLALKRATSNPDRDDVRKDVRPSE